jgi:hypothetical protein
MVLILNKTYINMFFFNTESEFLLLKVASFITPQPRTIGPTYPEAANPTCHAPLCRSLTVENSTSPGCGPTAPCGCTRLSL